MVASEAKSCPSSLTPGDTPSLVWTRERRSPTSKKKSLQWGSALFTQQRTQRPTDTHRGAERERDLVVKCHGFVATFSTNLLSERGTHKFVTEGEHLALTAITKEQSGSYECIASNDISSPDVRTVQVTVNCKDQNDHSHNPPFISKARSTGTPVGQKGILQCEASAVPRADFEWYKEDRRRVSPLISVTSTGLELLFNGLNRVKIENQGKQSMLVFFNVSEEDYGNYTCVAVNTMGITNASIILYGPGAMHDVNGAAVLPRPSVCLLLTATSLYLLKF
ncbi:Opioid-binding protein/cell adhesion molecule [Liparis tanakae]|uniref:Opioid-binding protein/cell adhesion molecule n=1 Tax=Liparis tanakae TaxID=230148 RepID=A0A4Z2IQT3_9TELE|nr:Opioid-binding protein/cell adhesion molecule [Liparis tanakae]